MRKNKKLVIKLWQQRKKYEIGERNNIDKWLNEFQANWIVLHDFAINSSKNVLVQRFSYSGFTQFGLLVKLLYFLFQGTIAVTIYLVFLFKDRCFAIIIKWCCPRLNLSFWFRHPPFSPRTRTRSGNSGVIFTFLVLRCPVLPFNLFWCGLSLMRVLKPGVLASTILMTSALKTAKTKYERVWWMRVFCYLFSAKLLRGNNLQNNNSSSSF